MDLVQVQNGTFHAIEVKWTNQLRAADLTQIQKYPGKAAILGKEPHGATFNGIATLKLVDYLGQLEEPD